MFVTVKRKKGFLQKNGIQICVCQKFGMYFKGTDTALPSHLEGTIALLCEYKL